MDNVILCIFEGAKTEKQIFKTLKTHFLRDEASVIQTMFCSDIYNLYKEIKKDDSLDIVEIMRERNKTNAQSLKNVERDQVSEIYLFFDYDSHATLAERHPETIDKMLELFDEETDLGRLYISYPMVESLKHLYSLDSKTCLLKKLDECCCEAESEKKYKGIVGEETIIHDFKRFDRVVWMKVINHNIKKLNCLNSGNYETPEFGEYIKFDQKSIYELQKSKAAIKNKVMVISAFPCFLLDYFGEALYEEATKQLKNEGD